MTSAALADCQGATSNSATKVRKKRTVFMEVAPVSRRARARPALQHQRRPKYRPLMKDLRRSVLLCSIATDGRFASGTSRRIRDGCVAMIARYQPCGATIIESILGGCRSGLASGKTPCFNGEAP